MESSALELFYDNYPLLVLLVPMIMLLCMMSICKRVKLFQDMIRLNQERNSRVILGNALDNAMEACKRLYDQGSRENLFIRLSSFRRGNQFFIEIVNSFDGKIFRRKEKEFPETNKADKKLHGMGLYHIKNTVEKYYGAME